MCPPSQFMLKNFFTFAISCAFITALLFSPFKALASDPSNEKQRACRENLKIMHEAVEKFMKNERTDLPTWSKLDDIYTMFLTGKYLPSKPVSPTSDCRYYFLMKNREIFDWYCDLHGCLSGDERVTFRYHEYQFTGLINSKYMDISKYKEHAENLRRWTRYSPTLVENIKFHYTQNPTTTILAVILGLAFLWFVFKNVFGP